MVDRCGPCLEYGTVACRLGCKPLLDSRRIHKAQSEALKDAVAPSQRGQPRANVLECCTVMRRACGDQPGVANGRWWRAVGRHWECFEQYLHGLSFANLLVYTQTHLGLIC